jgi:hypothetical protein
MRDSQLVDTPLMNDLYQHANSTSKDLRLQTKRMGDLGTSCQIITITS